jgi:hypothetical protein
MFGVCNGILVIGVGEDAIESAKFIWKKSRPNKRNLIGLHQPNTNPLQQMLPLQCIQRGLRQPWNICALILSCFHRVLLTLNPLILSSTSMKTGDKSGRWWVWRVFKSVVREFFDTGCTLFIHVTEDRHVNCQLALSWVCSSQLTDPCRDVYPKCDDFFHSDLSKPSFVSLSSRVPR